MPSKRKPRAGSLQFWPRKRAKRIYPRVSSYPSIDTSALEKPKILGFATYKAGMLHVIMKDALKGSATFGEDISVPVTVLDCPPMVAVGVRAYKMTPDGMAVITEAWADKLPKDLILKKKLLKKTKAKIKAQAKKKGEDKKMKKASTKKKTTASTHFAKMKKEMENIVAVRMIVATQPKLVGFGKKKSDVFEVEIAGKTTEDILEFAKEALGKEIKSTDVVREGEIVDTIGITTGRGTVGPVKRFGVAIQGPSAAGKRRHVGSLGQESPGKVRWTVPMAGQKGFHQRTEHNKRVLKMNDAEDAGKEVNPKEGFPHYGVIKGPYIILKGSVPGPRKRLIFIRTAIRPVRKTFTVPEIKEIVR